MALHRDMIGYEWKPNSLCQPGGFAQLQNLEADMVNVPFLLKCKKVFVAGHKGMVGSALVRRLAREDVEILTVDRSEVDLLDQAATNRWFADARPQVVLHAAAKVGGIVAK